MSKASVIIRRLESVYNPDTFTGFSPLGKEMKAEINVVVKDIFDALGGKSQL
ncbi:MAG: hypothetical protein MUP21_10265 [Dehalococcoidia bacterium]|nr:hypothetical protein [Dehalococcoidia bacterium]